MPVFKLIRNTLIISLRLVLAGLNIIPFVKQLRITDQVNLLEADDGYDVYLNPNFVRISAEMTYFTKNRTST